MVVNNYYLFLFTTGNTARAKRSYIFYALQVSIWLRFHLMVRVSYDTAEDVIVLNLEGVNNPNCH